MVAESPAGGSGGDGGVRGAGSRFRVRGEEIRCPVCHRREFFRVREMRRVKRPALSRWNVPPLDLDRSSTTLICVHSAYLLEFGRSPERVEDEDGAVP